MVKTSVDIQAKFALKYDAYVLMLRAKHMKYFSALKYAETVYMQYVLEIAINQAISDYDLAWGQKGRFFDLTEKLFAGKEVTLAKWLDSDLPEELYNKMPSIFASLLNLYSFCKNPTSKLMSRITISPIPQDILFPTSEDHTTQTTELSELEKLDLPTEDTTASILEAKVCCHNTVNTILAMLSNPLVGQTEIGLYPALYSAVSWKLNPYVFPILNIAVTNINVYNLAPTLNISVTHG